jgi:hypothetical protein
VQLSFFSSLCLRKFYYFEKNLLKNNYKTLINLSKEYFGEVKKNNPFLQHAYSHLLFHIIEQTEIFGPSKL